MNYSTIDRLKQALDSHRPLPPEVVANLRECISLNWIYHSNAIEGNTLTLIETKVVLEGITVGGKWLREHLEVVHHKEAIEYVESLVKDNEPLSEHIIKSIHQLLLRGIDANNAGVYRKNNVLIRGANHVPPDALQVPEAMRSFMHWYENTALALHPVERATWVHGEFVKIHPFIDGNGRTSRLLMNLELMKSGLPPAILPVERRFEYYRSLDAAHTKNDKDQFIHLIADIVENSFEPYLHALGLDKEKNKE